MVPNSRVLHNRYLAINRSHTVQQVEGSKYQQWVVLPQEGSSTRARLRLAKGNFCLTLEQGSDAGLVLDECKQGATFTFSGFSDDGDKQGARQVFEKSKKGSAVVR